MSKRLSTPDVFALLSHPIRISVLKHVANGVTSYAELLRELDVTSGVLQFHTAKLADANILDRTSRYYKLSSLGWELFALVREYEGGSESLGYDELGQDKGDKNESLDPLNLYSGLVKSFRSIVRVVGENWGRNRQMCGLGIQLSTLSTEQGMVGDALAITDYLLDNFTLQPDDLVLLKVRKAELLNLLYQNNQALNYVNRELEQTANLGTNILHLELLLEKARAEQVIFKEEEGFRAIKEFQKMLLLLTEEERISTSQKAFYQALAERELGRLNFLLDIHQASQYLGKSLDFFMENKQWPEMLGRIHRDIGINEMNAGNTEAALKHHQKSLAIFQDLQNQNELAFTEHAIGMLEEFSGNNEEAYHYYKTAFQRREKIGGKILLANSHHRLGSLARDNGDVKQAIWHIRTGVELLGKMGEPHWEAKLQIDLGDLLQQAGDYINALIRYNHCLELYRSLKNVRGVAKVLNQMGNLYLQKGEYLLAEDILGQAVEVAQSVQAFFEEALAYVWLGYVRLERGKPEEALEKFDKFIEIMKHHGPGFGVAQGVHLKAGVFVRSGDISSAVDHFNHFIEVCRNLKYPPMTTQGTYQFIHALTDHKFFNEARLTLGKFGEIKKTRTLGPLEQLLERYSRALVDMGGQSLLERASAKENLREVVEQTKEDQLLHTSAVLHLAELLLWEHEYLGSKEAYLKAKTIVNELQGYGEDQGSVRIEVETMVIQYKMALMEEDQDRASQVMSQLTERITNYGIPKMARKILENQHNHSSVTGVIQGTIMTPRLAQVDLTTLVREMLQNHQQLFPS